MSIFTIVRGRLMKGYGKPFLIVLVLSFYAAVTNAEGCLSGDGIDVICGFLPPEDIDVIPQKNVLVVGGFSLDNQNGDIRVFHPEQNLIETIYNPDDSGPTYFPDGEVWGDPNCPGPPTGFAAHGIQISKNKMGSYTLLVVNHTSREAIEWLEVREKEGRYSADWRGCVVVPAPLWINDVSMLPDGGFVASHMMPREISRTIFDRKPNDRVETGYVVEWHKDRGWSKIEGTDGALPNGVQVSKDGKTVYSNHYFSNQIVAIDRESGQRKWQTPVEGAPDNINIGDDGQLYFPTHLTSLREIRNQCLGKSVDYCVGEFAVYAVDPQNGRPTQLFRSQGRFFGSSTAAAKIGQSVYLGSVGGDRIGRIDAP